MWSSSAESALQNTCLNAPLTLTSSSHKVAEVLAFKKAFYCNCSQ